MTGDSDIEDFYDDLVGYYATEAPNTRVRTEIRLPALRSLLPNLDGARVLDAGCGAGADAAWLDEQGASVVGVDLSREMLRAARETTPATASLRADLAEPLPFDEVANPE